MERTHQIRYFLFSQYFSDGLRITLEIIIPAVAFSLMGRLDEGLSLSLGALCVSISDGPGPVVHKRNGMLFCNLFIFISALLTGLLNHNPFTLGLLVVAAAFIFTMFSLYGKRATSVGFAALLIVILQMPQVLPYAQVLNESILILMGGMWYMLLALLLFRLAPYRPAQRSIADCLKETARYLSLRAELYDPEVDLTHQYHQLISQQVQVSAIQDSTRELLFKNRALLKESTRTGRLLVLTFVDIVDLFETIMASGYDYEAIRSEFGSTGILKFIARMITELASEIDNIGRSIQSNSSYTSQYDIAGGLRALEIHMQEVDGKGENAVLRKIWTNLQNIALKIDAISGYFNEDLSSKRKLRSSKEYSRFVTQQNISWKVFRNNLTFASSIFRHSMRVAIACGAAFILSRVLLYGHHSYWIIMTIVIILKPAFSLTREKNRDRLLGTAGGGLLGLLLLYFVHDKTALFSLMVFFMLGTYTYKSLNYVVMVIFLTPYILILFHFLGLGALNVAGERLLDTAIGCLLAGLASYFLFPVWESDQLQTYMAAVLGANIRYLEKLRELVEGIRVPSLDYKVVRKELMVSTANLSAALHRMQSEPLNKQRHKNEIYEFVVLNNLLSSNVASLTSEINAHPATDFKGLAAPLTTSIGELQQSLFRLDENYQTENRFVSGGTMTSNQENSCNPFMPQLQFVRKLVVDIDKVTRLIAGRAGKTDH